MGEFVVPHTFLELPHLVGEVAQELLHPLELWDAIVLQNLPSQQKRRQERKKKRRVELMHIVTSFHAPGICCTSSEWPPQETVGPSGTPAAGKTHGACTHISNMDWMGLRGGGAG